MADTVLLKRPGTEQKSGRRSAGKKTPVDDDADIKRIASSKPREGADFGELDIATQQPIDYDITPFVSEQNDKTVYKRGHLVVNVSATTSLINTVTALKQDGSQLVIGTHNGTVVTWDMIDGCQVSSLQASKLVPVHKDDDDEPASPSAAAQARPVAPSSPTASLPSGSDQKTPEPDVEVQRVVLSISAVDNVKAPVGTASSGLLFGCATGETGIWNPQSGLCLNIWRDHTEKVAAVRFVDNCIYSVGYDGCFVVRSLETDRVIQMYTHCTCPLSALLVLDASNVLLGSWDGTIRQLNLKTQKVVAEFTTPENAPVRCLAYHPPQELLFASYGVGGIRSWDIRTQSVYVDSYSGHTDVVNCLKAHKNRLYSGSDDKTVRVWDIVKGVCLDALSGPADGVSALELIDVGTAIGSMSSASQSRMDSLDDSGATAPASATADAASGERLIVGSFDGKVRQYRVGDIENAIETRRWRMEEGRRISAELFRKYKEDAKARRKKGKSGSAKGKANGKSSAPGSAKSKTGSAKRK